MKNKLTKLLAIGLVLALGTVVYADKGEGGEGPGRKEMEIALEKRAEEKKYEEPREKTQEEIVEEKRDEKGHKN